MTATRQQAIDEMLALLKTAWDATSYADNVVWPNKDGAPPAQREPWIRPKVQHVDGGNGSISGANGVARYVRLGFITVQLFVPSGQGLSTEATLSKIIIDAYEGKKTASGVWFRNVRAREVGEDGEFHQTNIIIDFEYDEIK